MKKLLLAFTALIIGSPMFAQFTTTAGGGAAGVIAAIGGPGLTVSGVTINCPNNAYGSFSGGAASGMGISNGLMLTTGSVTTLPGAGNLNDDFSTCNGTSGTDPQLTAIIGGASINDMCIIEFDVVPQCNNMSITFVFGSDEYTNWVSAGFNDAFGFFVSGPNPGGGSYTNLNIATIPGGTPVSIDNVNHLVNTAYFVNNNAGTYANHFDGFTTVLTPSINVTPCASYHIKLAIADASDCIVDSGVLIDLIQCTSPWTVATSSTPASCGASNGTATATVTGGIGPFTYSWSPGGATTATASGLAAGTYTVTVNDGLSCTPPQSFNVTVGSTGTPPTIGVTASSTICNGGSVVLTATGGTSYTWSPGTGLSATTGATVTASPTTTTTYTVTGTGACGSGTASTTITVNNPPNAGTNGAITVCSTGASVNLFASLGGTPAGTGTWTGPSALTGGSLGTYNPATANPGVYTYTVTGAAPCPNATATVTVTETPMPTATISYPGPFCTTSAAQNVTQTGTGGGTYTVSPAGLTINAANGQITPASSTAGTYTVTYTIAAAGGCPAFTTTTSVTINTPPNAGTNGTITVCSTGASVNLFASLGGTPAATGTWTGPSALTGGSLGTYNPATANPGVYTYTVTGTAPCPNATATVTVTETPMPAATIAYAGPYCTSSGVQNVTQTGTGGGTYTVAPAGLTINAATGQITPSTSTAGTYTVTYTIAAAGGCPAFTTTASVTITAPPTATIAYAGPYCTSSGVQNVTQTGTTGGTYTAAPAGLSINAATGQITPGSSTAGTYTVTYTIAAAGGCPVFTTTATVTITAPPAATIAYAGPFCITAAAQNVTQTGTVGGTYTVSPAGLTINAATGQITPSTSTAGTYTVTYTIAASGGCPVFTTTTTVTINPNPVVNVNSAAICAGASATLTATGATTYTWSPGTGLSATTGATVTSTPAATITYTVTGTTAGCTGTATSTVTINSNFDATITPIAAQCIDNPPVTFTAVDAGGTWSATCGACIDAVTGAFDPATAGVGTYTITYTIPGSCGDTDTETITVNPLPTIVVGDISICAGSSGTLSASGGSTYTWSPATGLSATTGATVTAGPAATTTYTITGTDVNGCVNSTTATVTVSGMLDPTISPMPAVCETDAPVTFTAVDPGGTWSATCGGCINSATGVFDPALGTIGINTITYTITGSCGGTDTETITVNANADPSFTVTTPLCTTSPATTFTATQAGGSWSATCGTCINAATGVFDPAVSGAGTFTITYTIAGMCGASSTNTVNVQEVIINSVDTTGVSCNGGTDGTITINATGATGYDIGTGFVPTNVFNVGAGTYTITVQNAIGCQATTTAVVNEPTPLTGSVAFVQDETCAGACDGIIVVAPAGGTPTYSFSWTSGSTAALADNLCTGSYTVTITDDNGCITTVTQAITGPVAVSITSITPVDPLCNGGSDGSITVVASGGTLPYNYTLNGGTPQASNTFAGLPAGSYTITVTDNAGCAATGTTILGEPAALSIVASPDVTICENGSTVLTATPAGGTAPYTITWTPATGLSTTTGTSVTANPTTNTTYTASVTDFNGCPAANDVVSVTVNPPLLVDAFTSTTICPGQTAVINASGSGGDGNLTYTWTNNQNATTMSGATQTVSPATTTIYTVTLSDGCGSTPVTSTVTIGLYTLPPVVISPSNPVSGCMPVVVDFDNLTGNSASCLWDFGDGNSSTNCTQTYAYNTPGCYDISLTVTTADGCVVDTLLPDYVCVYAIPQADFSFTPNPADVFNTGVQFTNLTIGGNTYSWDFEGMGTSSDVHPFFAFPDDSAGIYTVCLNTISANGCVDTVCHDVEVLDQFLLYVPNSFTPDGDGINDIFLPILQGEDPLSYELFVFNRWGELIFQSNNKLIGWDGTHKNIKSKEDVYVWKIRVKKKINEDKIERIGHVNLLR